MKGTVCVFGHTFSITTHDLQTSINHSERQFRGASYDGNKSNAQSPWTNEFSFVSLEYRTEYEGFKFILTKMQERVFRWISTRLRINYKGKKKDKTCWPMNSIGQATGVIYFFIIECVLHDV